MYAFHFTGQLMFWWGSSLYQCNLFSLSTFFSQVCLKFLAVCSCSQCIKVWLLGENHVFSGMQKVPYFHPVLNLFLLQVKQSWWLKEKRKWAKAGVDVTNQMTNFFYEQISNWNQCSLAWRSQFIQISF